MLIEEELTDRIINAFYHVYNTLGIGYQEHCYENALAIELRKRNMTVEQQTPITVFYEGHEIGHYRTDLIVDGKVIVEIKAAAALCEQHLDQLRNYLRATTLEVGLLLNFGTTPEVKRRVFSNSRKKLSV